MLADFGRVGIAGSCLSQERTTFHQKWSEALMYVARQQTLLWAHKGSRLMVPKNSQPDPGGPRTTPMARAGGVRPGGLSSEEARNRLEQFGANAMPDGAIHPLRSALEKFCAPVPWMLEGAIVLELMLGKYVEAVIIVALLVFNAVLGLVQESRAQATLAALKSRLALEYRTSCGATGHGRPSSPCGAGTGRSGRAVARRRGRCGHGKDSSGERSCVLDQSMLTGESVPIEAGPGVQAYAGALVCRGEASAEVTATGVRTKFGRTAELVRTAHVVGSQQKAVLRVVRNLAAFNGLAILALTACGYYLTMPLTENTPLILTAILASIPVALPATFTLASALGARALAKRGVLPTRLSAVDEAGTTDILCADKTGTLTQNALTVTVVRPMPGFDAAHVLALAALASSDGGQDPVDRAIRAAAANHTACTALKVVEFDPFDPAKRISAARTADASGETQRVVKGACAARHRARTCLSRGVAATAQELEGASVLRVLAVAAGPPRSIEAGIGLSRSAIRHAPTLTQAGSRNCAIWVCAPSCGATGDACRQLRS